MLAKPKTHGASSSAITAEPWDPERADEQGPSLRRLDACGLGHWQQERERDDGEQQVR